MSIYIKYIKLSWEKSKMFKKILSTRQSVANRIIHKPKKNIIIWPELCLSFSLLKQIIDSGLALFSVVLNDRPLSCLYEWMENIVHKGQGRTVNRLSNRRKGDGYYHNSRISYMGFYSGLGQWSKFCILNCGHFYVEGVSEVISCKVIPSEFWLFCVICINVDIISHR